MKQVRNFLVVCGETERLFLLSGVLHRVFPNSAVQTCRDAEVAVATAKAQRFDVVVAARPSDGDAISLVRQLGAATGAPIIAVADQWEKDEMLAAGAARFLGKDEWLLLGKLVAEQIGAATS